MKDGWPKIVEKECKGEEKEEFYEHYKKVLQVFFETVYENSYLIY